MRLLPLFCGALLLTAAVSTQTHTLRGKVEDVQGTANQFFLDGTTIPLVSTALNLNLWQGQQAMLDVVNIGTATAPLLRVDAAVATTKVMDMGNLRLGETKTWEVFAQAGSAAFVFVGWTSNTGFLPVPGFGGVWLLGTQPSALNAGITSNFGVFQFQFTMPNLPGLIGLEVSSQAVVGDPSNNWSLSNVDSKEIEN